MNKKKASSVNNKYILEHLNEVQKNAKTKKRESNGTALMPIQPVNVNLFNESANDTVTVEMEIDPLETSNTEVEIEETSKSIQSNSSNSANTIEVENQAINIELLLKYLNNVQNKIVNDTKSTKDTDSIHKTQTCTNTNININKEIIEKKNDIENISQQSVSYEIENSSALIDEETNDSSSSPANTIQDKSETEYSESSTDTDDGNLDEMNLNDYKVITFYLFL